MGPHTWGIYHSTLIGAAAAVCTTTVLQLQVLPPLQLLLLLTVLHKGGKWWPRRASTAARRRRRVVQLLGVVGMGRRRYEPAGPLVVQDGHANETLGRMRHVRHIGCLQFGRQLPLPFVATVLEPDFHLRLREPQGCCQTGALRRAEVPEEGTKREDVMR